MGLMINKAVVHCVLLFLFVLKATSALNEKDESQKALRGSVKKFYPSIIVEEGDCTILAPCSNDDDTSLQYKRCVTFYPKRFWDGLDRNILTHQYENRPANCWYETELVSLSKDNGDASKRICGDDDDDTSAPRPERIVYFHNFKVGGTTIVKSLTLNDIPGYYHPEPNFLSYNTKNIFPDGNGKYRDRALELQAEIAEQQQQLQQNEEKGDVVAFTFVRSPVTRFLSGLAQVQRMALNWETSPGSRHCFDILNGAKKVECIVDHILETKVFFNVHIYPQAYLFDVWTNYGELDNMSFIVAHVDDMDDVLHGLTRLEKEIKQQNKSKDTDKVQISDLNEEIIYKICQLYMVDVQLLHVLGMDDPICDVLLTNANGLEANKS